MQSLIEKLTAEEKALLCQWQVDPVARGLLAKVLQPHQPLRYKPSTTSNGADFAEQSQHWVFASGRAFENDRIAKILIGDDNE